MSASRTQTTVRRVLEASGPQLARIQQRVALPGLAGLQIGAARPVLSHSGGWGNGAAGDPEAIDCETARETRHDQSTGGSMSRASTDVIQVGALGVRFLVEAADSNGSVSVFECFVPADSTMPVPHSHDAFEETVYGLEGVTTWRVDGRPLDVRPGEALCIPRGAVHGFDNNGTEDAKFLAVASPGVMSPDYFREIHEVLGASLGGPPDRAKIAEVMRRHGLTPAPPAS